MDDNVIEFPQRRKRIIRRRELAPVLEIQPRLVDSYAARIAEIDAQLHALVEERHALKAKLKEANAV